MEEAVIRDSAGKSMQIRRAVEADLGAMLDLIQAVVGLCTRASSQSQINENS